MTLWLVHRSCSSLSRVAAVCERRAGMTCQHNQSAHFVDCDQQAELDLRMASLDSNCEHKRSRFHAPLEHWITVH